MTDLTRQDLTLEEKAKPYAKYFYRQPAAPDPARVAAMDNPMDPVKALPIERINDLLNPGYFEVEAGWCVLPNGAGYIANYTPMPGVTIEMINWWFAWHSLEDLRYKIWWPDGHFGISLSDRDRTKVLDPNRTMIQKFQGLTHYVLENVGGPSAEKIAISFMAPEDVGFDMARFKSPYVGTIAAANGSALLLNPPPGAPNFKTPAFMIHFIREIPGGIEFRTRFWMGYHVLNKKPFLLIPKGIRVPDEVPAGLARHNVCEYANLASFLPEIYAEQKGVIS
jgi:phloretin hydrolase